VIGELQREKLATYLSRELGRGPLRVVSASRIAMGQSRAMYRVEIESAAAGAAPPERRSVIVRVEQWGLLGTDSSEEVRAMQALHAAGFPAAKVFCYERSHDILGQPFFVMELLPGTSVFEPATTDEYVRALHRLHQLDWRAAGLDFFPVPQGPQDSALLQVERWYSIYRWALVGEPSPLVEEAAEWLRRHAPATERVTVVHGDPGPGNYLHEDGRIVALVDWEFTHLGDPEEDWAYLICMRGVSVMGEDAWVKRIRDIVGIDLEPERLRYWKAVNYFKAACIDQTALKLYMDGTNTAPNLLAIGTGVHLSALKRLCDTVLR